jgi:hypothetical protein
MARLLSQMNREVELGNDIDLNLLLTRLGNIFPPQDDPEVPPGWCVVLVRMVCDAGNRKSGFGC